VGQLTEAEAARPRKASAARLKADRLEPAHWIAAADDLLIQRGVDAIRIDPLAKTLSVTKGSFYWHFESRDALLDAVLQDWHQRMTLSVIERIEQTLDSPAARLRALLALRSSGERSERDAQIELAIRLWARTDGRARKALDETDRLRLNYFIELFGKLGHPADAARAKALLAYSYMRVAASLLYEQQDADLAKVEAVLLA
jgi:AcrR family transcriptional regulator